MTELQPNKRGRKFLLGAELDSKVQTFVNNIRISGGVINTAIVMASGRGIVLAKDRSMLYENGGHIQISKSWAVSLLKRMGMVKRNGTTSKKVINVDNFENEKEKFLKNIKSKIELNDIPPQLIINWDQTGLHVVPFVPMLLT